MDKKKRKKIFIYFFVMLLLLINIVWYAGMFRPYFLLQNKMKNHPNYIGSGEIYDEDGYTYAVHYPTYLYWKDGNLSISPPFVENDKVQVEDGKTAYAAGGGDIIIWLNHFTGDVKEIGLILNINDETRYIYLIDSKTAKYEDDQILVDESQEIIKVLFEKVEDAWDLEMPWKE